MLYKLLGRQARVIDKAATIQFRKPAKRTLYAIFRITQQELGDIRRDLESGVKLERVYTIDLVDDEGVTHVSCEKVLCIIPAQRVRQ